NVGDRKGQGGSLCIYDVLKVGENSLGGFRPQIDCAGGVFHRAHEGLEHQVELASGGQLAAAFGTSITLDFVRAKTILAAFAIDHRVAEVLQMPRCLPGAPMLEDCPVQPEDV